MVGVLDCAALVGQQGVGQIPEDVIERDVHFLHAVDGVGVDDQAVVEQAAAAHRAAVAAGEADGAQPHVARLGEGLHQVVGVAAGGKPHQAVTGARMRFELAGEHVAHADVVAYCGEHGHVHHQIHRRQRRASRRDGMLELHAKVCGVAAGAAVAHGEHLPAAGIDGGQGAGAGHHLLGMVAVEAFLGGHAVRTLAPHRFEQRRVFLRGVLGMAVEEGVEAFERRGRVHLRLPRSGAWRRARPPSRRARRADPESCGLRRRRCGSSRSPRAPAPSRPRTTRAGGRRRPRRRC